MNPPDTDAFRRTKRCCYRPRRYYFWLGVGTLIAFVAMGVGSVAAAWWNFDGSFAHPRTAALIFGIFWSMFAFGSLWLLAAYFRERLRLGPSAVVSRGVCRVHRVRLADVETIVWRRYPAGGSIVIRTPAKRVKVELANFTRPEQKEIAAYFREAIALPRQDGWESFVASVQSPRKASPGAELVSFSVLSAFAATFVIVGWRRGEIGYVILGLVNAAIAMGLNFFRRPAPSTPPHR